jgi:hypothetical protein
MDYCEADAATTGALPPRASLQFAERLRVAASAASEPSLLKRLANALRWQFAERRWAVMATACLLLIAPLILILLRAERQVSAQELLRRTTQAEAMSLSRVGEPVVYRKLQVKRAGTNETFVWESWNDARRNQFRQRVTDKDGLRFLRSNDGPRPSLLAELEEILRVNRFDPQRPLSAEAFAEWRQTIKTISETVAARGDELRLTTIAAPPYAVNTITEAALTVRKSDWHAVALELRVQAENELRDYELSEMAYEVLPLQALTVFADLPPEPAPLGAPRASPTVVTASPAPTVLSRAALQAAEVAALYALHQAQADLGEQIEVVIEDGRQVVVRGLVQTAERKEELIQALSRIALVSPQFMTIEEAVQQTQRATNPPAAIETGDIVTGGPPAAAVKPFQQKVIEYFGGRKGMSEAERQEVNRQVTQFYNAVEADAAAALTEAWALRRLQERFASTISSDLDTISRQRLEEIESNHLSRLRRRSLDLQTRLRPLLAAIASDAPVAPQPIEATRQTQILAAFRATEQISRLTDQLIAGDAVTPLSQTARALLMELARLDAALIALEKN